MLSSFYAWYKLLLEKYWNCKHKILLHWVTIEVNIFLGFQRTNFEDKNGLNKLAEEENLNHLFRQQFALHTSKKTVSYKQSHFDFLKKMLSQLFFNLIRAQKILEPLGKFQIQKK